MTTAVVKWPVEVWFDGRRTFQATLNFGARPITVITLDPACRFPDRNPRGITRGPALPRFRATVRLVTNLREDEDIDVEIEAVRAGQN